MLVQRHPGGRAALRLMRQLLKKQGCAPKQLVTKLRPYPLAFPRLPLSCPHETGAQEKQSRRELASGGATQAQMRCERSIGYICPLRSMYII
jgi:hypothetical protein